jgi:sugar (pentulose or hexulose) kinase
MSKGYVVGFDSGTQSVKFIVVDAKGNIVSEGSAAHESTFHQQPGWTEQHPEDNWVKFCQACQETMARLPVPKSELAAVGVTGQRGTTTVVDEDGTPIRPFVLWLDPRYVDFPNWLRQNEPENYDKAYKFISVQGWLVKHLTGEFKDCIAYPPAPIRAIDTPKLAWSEDPATYEAVGVSREKMLDVYPPGTVYGTITREAAEATGLPEGLPVVAGAGDKQCEALGAGAVTRGRAYITYGTYSSIAITTYDRPIVAKAGEYHTLGAAVAGAWGSEGGIGRGHWLVSWFRDQFASQAVEEARKRGVSPEQILNEEAEKVPPGAEGLILFPYWLPWPTIPQAKGLILGFYDAVHKRPHVFRAILEGIAYGLRGIRDILVRDSGVPIEAVTIGGGGSKSNLGMQATADILGIPCSRPHTPETCALGAAIDGAVGVGMYADFEDAIKHMTRSERVFEPIPQNQELYDAIYEKVFTQIYPSLEGVFTSLNELSASRT